MLWYKVSWSPFYWPPGPTHKSEGVYSEWESYLTEHHKDSKLYLENEKKVFLRDDIDDYPLLMASKSFGKVSESMKYDLKSEMYLKGASVDNWASIPGRYLMNK